jgi:hypothetical protein
MGQRNQPLGGSEDRRGRQRGNQPEADPARDDRIQEHEHGGGQACVLRLRGQPSDQPRQDRPATRTAIGGPEKQHQRAQAQRQGRHDLIQKISKS